MLNEALRLIRVFHDMKQTEAADKLGISRSYLSELEKGAKEPSLEVLDKYAATFNIPKSSILFFSESMDESEAKRKAKKLVAPKIIQMLQFVEGKSGRPHD